MIENANLITKEGSFHKKRILSEARLFTNKNERAGLIRTAIKIQLLLFSIQILLENCHRIYSNILIRFFLNRAVSFDHLNLAKDDKARKILQKHADGIYDEIILYSNYVTKINRKSKSQQRILIITNAAIYNLTLIY